MKETTTTETTNIKYLITGAAGFIGSFLSKSLLSQGKNVIGVDNINDYYDIRLKKERQALRTGETGEVHLHSRRYFR